jgi:hypothetical protein
VAVSRSSASVILKDAMMLDSALIAAWHAAGRELGVEVVAPHRLNLPGGAMVEVEAFLPDFGGPEWGSRRRRRLTWNNPCEK